MSSWVKVVWYLISLIAFKTWIAKILRLKKSYHSHLSRRTRLICTTSRSTWSKHLAWSWSSPNWMWSTHSASNIMISRHQLKSCWNIKRDKRRDLRSNISCKCTSMIYSMLSRIYRSSHLNSTSMDWSQIQKQSTICRRNFGMKCSTSWRILVLLRIKLFKLTWRTLRMSFQIIITKWTWLCW